MQAKYTSEWGAFRVLAAITYAGMLVLSGAAYAQAVNEPDALWEKASVYRDEWGSPHVYADNLRALAFAFGYAKA